jgi:hypothetical protein
MKNKLLRQTPGEEEYSKKRREMGAFAGTTERWQIFNQN